MSERPKREIKRSDNPNPVGRFFDDLGSEAPHVVPVVKEIVEDAAVAIAKKLGGGKGKGAKAKEYHAAFAPPSETAHRTSVSSAASMESAGEIASTTPIGRSHSRGSSGGEGIGRSLGGLC